MACVLSPCVEGNTGSSAAAVAAGSSSSAPQPSPFQPSPLQLRPVDRGNADDTLTAVQREQAERAAAKVKAETERRQQQEDSMSRPMSPKFNEQGSESSDAMLCDGCCCVFFKGCGDPAVRAWLVRAVGVVAIINFVVAVSLDHAELLAAALSAMVAWMALYNHAVQKDIRSLKLPHEARGIDARAIVLRGMEKSGPGLGNSSYIGGHADSAAALDNDLVQHARELEVDFRSSGVSDETLQTLLMSSMANEYIRNVAMLRCYQDKYGRLHGVPDANEFTVFVTAQQLLAELGFDVAAMAEGGRLLRSPARAQRGGVDLGEGTNSSMFKWSQLDKDDLDRLELDVTASSFDSFADGARGSKSCDVRDVPPMSANSNASARAGSSGGRGLPALLASQAHTGVEDLSKGVDDSKKSVDRKSSKIQTPSSVMPPVSTGAASSTGAPPSPAVPKQSIEDSRNLPLWLRQIRS